MRIRPLMASLALAGTCSFAHAQTGVSDDRVSLPDGPGSLGGIGENVSLDPNMGVMRYGVPIDVPRGFAGVTPNLRLGYSSGGGSSVVGVGWDLPIPHIERRTARGLPRYTADDQFAADGGTQLVRVADGATPTYRARFEGGFVRYSWHDSGDGAEGYWLAEYPDGRMATFGATADGTLVPSARVSGPDGTFRYMVVDVIDVHGHRLNHTYQSIDGYALLRQMDYVFTDGAPQYSVSFGYEDRADASGADILSDAKAGFDERLTQRLAAINVFSGEDRIRRYELDYERYADSGGFTRLSAVRTLGLDGSTHPAVQRFGWSRALEGVCNAGDDCARPFVIDMGNIGVNIGVGRATLIDINGDALPDLVDTSDDGAHQFLLNVPAVDGRMRFSDQPVSSAVGIGSGFRLGTPFVQVLDVNGDGYADLLDARNGRALINDGSGDWATLVDLADTAAVGDALGADFDAGEGGLRTLRFVDMDNDKRIDMLRSTRESTRLFRNTGEGFEVVDGVDPLGYDLAVDGIDMSDMNGDGLLDAVKLNVGGLRYRLNLGHGRWGDEVEVLGLPIDESELDLASLEDLNGDGLSDLVVVVGRQIKYAINRNGTTFSQIATLDSAAVDGELPLRDATVSVIMADVNGNGSTDVVWLDAQGQVTALELFPIRPNQLSRVENSLGMVTEITYTTSVQEMARDGDWAFTLPHAMQVVAEIDRSDSATGLHQVTRYRYRDGFYDGEEKQFRGFARVELDTLGDDSQEAGLTVNVYEVGAEDPYRHGRLLTSEVRSADRLINRTENTYADCPVAEVPATAPAVRFICMTGATSVIAEGAAAAEHVTLREESTYDGYGNVTVQANLGVVAVGGSACAPCQPDTGGACGAECAGDEVFTETDFIAPGAATDDRWILGRPARMARFGDPASDLKTERLYHYDGPAFEGLPNGRLTRGLLTRVTARVSATETIEVGRYRRDDHGNIVEMLDPLGTVGGDLHRAHFTMDADGLRVTAMALPLEDPDGQPYSLVRELTYEPVFDRVAQAGAWRVIDAAGDPRSAPRITAYTYDAFNRVASVARPGDANGAPGSEYTYELRDGISRVVSRARSTVGGPLDREMIVCLDGRGRTLQTRTRVGDGRYQVNGLTVYNVNGEPFRIYQPYLSDAAACDAEAPAGVLFTEVRRDATGRALTVTEADAGIHGAPSVTRSEYAPLVSTIFDAEDTDPQSPHADTPNRVERDGLGRIVAVERTLADGSVGAVRQVYDGLGRIVAAVDTDGHVKRQTYDLLGRVLRVDDPNKAGALAWTYDAAGNVRRFDDGTGALVEYEYDALNRMIARYEAAAPEATREALRWDFDPDCDPARCTNTAGTLARETSPGLDAEPTVTRRGFDARGRLIHVERHIEGVPLVFGFEYDNVNRATQQTYPAGEALTYRYDAGSRLIGIDGFVDAIEYDARGMIAALAYSNGTRTTMARDDLARLTERRVTDGAGALIQGLRFERDRIGNIRTIDDDAAGLPRGATYEYDAWYRVIRSAGADGQVITNTYALNDNVTGRAAEGDPVRTLTGAYAYDSAAPNALTRVGDVAFEYDPAGQVITRGNQHFTWDPMGRLRSVDDGDAVLAEYAYGTDHVRTARREGDALTLYGAGNWQLRDGVSVLHVQVGRQRVARVENDALATTALPDLAPIDALDDRITAADAWIALGVDGADTPAVGALLESSLKRMFMEQAGAVWLHADHLDSIVMATDPDGVLVGERAFEPTGAERDDSVGYVDEYGFTGQAIDRATGLVHFAHRLLDPATGRWMSADPLFATLSPSAAMNPAEALNVFGYVGNNSANLVDPLGLNSQRNSTGSNNSGGSGGSGGSQTPSQRLAAQKAAQKAAKKAAKDAEKARKASKKAIKRAIKKADVSGLDNAQLAEVVTQMDEQLTDVALAQAVAKKITGRSTGQKVKGGVEIGIGIIEIALGIVELGVPGAQPIGIATIAIGVATIGLGVSTVTPKEQPAKHYDLTNADDAAAFLAIVPKPARELRQRFEGIRQDAQNALNP